MLDVARDLRSCRSLLLDGSSDGRGNCIQLADHPSDAANRNHGPVGRLLDLGDLAADLLRRLAGLACEAFYFGCDNSKSLAGITGARSLDGSVQCQQIGLSSDVADELDHVPDPLPTLRQRADSGIGLLRFLDGSPGHSCRLGDLL